jgi:hypothetical protein
MQMLEILFAKVIKHKGKADFIAKNQNKSKKSEFVIYHYPNKTMLFAENIGLDLDNFHYSFEGELDDGRTISGELLGGFGEFEPKEIIICQNNLNKCHIGKFYLIHLCIKTHVIFSYSDFEITISSLFDQDSECQSLIKCWQNMELETAVLNIKTIEAIDSEKFLNLAIDISYLLSLVSGEMIIFNRQNYQHNKYSKEVWKRRIKEPNAGNKVINQSDYKSYLEKCLPVFQQLSKKQKEAIIDAINYINTTKRGFVEDRIMRVCQAWEALADKFLDSNSHKKSLKPALEDLKTRIEQTYDSWKQNCFGQDINSNLKSRIINPITQLSTVEKLNKLADYYKFNYKKIGLDFQKLIRQRNSRIAHIGRMKNTIGEEAARNILEPAVLGIQILILKILKYDGYIITNDNGLANSLKIK